MAKNRNKKSRQDGITSGNASAADGDEPAGNAGVPGDPPAMQKTPRRGAAPHRTAASRWVVLAAVITVVVIGGVLGFAQFSPSVDYSDARVVAMGEGLYATNCQACHGPQAKGESPFNIMGGRKLNGDYWAPALNGTAHAWHHPPDMLFSIVKKGSPAPDSRMRGWQGRMTDEEIHSVLAYVKSLWPEELRFRYDKANGLR